jgi:D-alanine transaminase
MTVFLNGDFVAPEAAKISVFDRGFIFGDGIYELIPVYAGKPFRLDEHLQRMENGLAAIRITNPYSREEWKRHISKLLDEHPGEQLSVYIQVTRGVAPRDHVFPVPAPVPTVLISVSPLPQPSQSTREDGVKAVSHIDIRWDRCDIKAVSLLANVLLRQHAVDQGVAETILIRDGMLTEGSTTTVFIVKDGVIAVPPLSHFMLPGITYDVLLELAKHHGAPCEVRPISEAELHAADEIWLASSSKEVLAVVELDGKPVGDGRVGPVQRKMFAWYQDFKSELIAS